MTKLNIIYKAKNTQRKCFYVGYSINGLSTRKTTHKHMCFQKNKNYKFYNFLRKYGWDSFTWEILAVYSTKEELPSAEIEWLAEQKKEFSDWECLNMTQGGDGQLNPSEETRMKIRNARLGKHPSEETREKMRKNRKGTGNAMFGRRHTTITKKLIGLKSLNRYFSIESRKKQSMARIRNSPKYIFISPCNEEFVIQGNFTKFCKDNILVNQSMYKIINNPSKTHRGWRVKKLENINVT